MPKNFWPDQVLSFLDQLGIDVPIIQAPMAGGPSTPELVGAVSNAGGLGSLGVGYLSPDQIDSEIKKVKKLTDRPYNVNLFVPETTKDYKPSDIVLKKLEEFSIEFGIDPPQVPGFPKYTFEDQVEAIIENQVPVFSFTFGIPEQSLLEQLKEKGVFIIGTATCVEEGSLLQQAGCNAIVAQGSEAGGHRGTFATTEGSPMIGGISLIPQLVDQVKTPVIASGGIMDGRGIAASLALGASAFQLGTAFLGCEEAGVAKPWLDFLFDSKDTSTVLTKAFSGKYARGIKNRFIEEMDQIENEVPPYPIQNSLTRPLRDAAREKGNADFLSLWAGQGSTMSRRCSAQELISVLVSETRETLLRINSNL